MYIPKSKYELLETNGNEFKLKKTGKNYIGPYLLTSEGAFVGRNIKDLSERLIPIEKAEIINNIHYDENTISYNKANNRHNFNFLSKSKSIYSTKTRPTLKDYERGHYLRYFCFRRNDRHTYYEIDKKTYKSIKSKNNEYDHYLYGVSNIMWAIDGDILKANTKILANKSRFFPNVHLLFPKLNEFQRLRYTEGGELTYLNGIGYEGYYHLHNGKPMVGQNHTSTPHKNLAFIEKETLTAKNSIISLDLSLDSINNNNLNIMFNDILKELSPETQQTYEAPDNIKTNTNNTTPNYSNNTSSGNVSSGGGGGGY